MNIGDCLAPATLTAVLSLVAATVLGFLTARAMRSAGFAGGAVLELELAGNVDAFTRLLQPLGAPGVNRLRIAHYWDCAFAVAYGVAICALLQAVAPHLPAGAHGAVHAISWLGLAAGAFDLLENACLLRRFATYKPAPAGKPAPPAPPDGVLRTAALAAIVKFVLIGFCINALCWGLVQALAVYLLGGVST